jgi:ribosome-associated protein
VSAAIQPDGASLRYGLVIPAAELEWRFSRAGGPGGQSVNTADSRVELRWDLAGSPVLPDALRQRALARLDHRLIGGVLTVTAAEHRAQLQNRRAALTRLVALVNEAIAPGPPPRRATRPSRGAVRSRLATKRRRGEVKRGRRLLGPED